MHRKLYDNGDVCVCVYVCSTCRIAKLGRKGEREKEATREREREREREKRQGWKGKRRICMCAHTCTCTYTLNINARNPEHASSMAFLAKHNTSTHYQGYITIESHWPTICHIRVEC